MINGNLNCRSFPFFNSVKEPLTQTGTSESFWNNGYSLLTLELSGASSISATIQGCVNTVKPDGEQKADNECTWTQLATISATDLDKKSLMANGIYYISIAGLSRVRVVVSAITGSATICGQVSSSPMVH